MEENRRNRKDNEKNDKTQTILITSKIISTILNNNNNLYETNNEYTEDSIKVYKKNNQAAYNIEIYDSKGKKHKFKLKIKLYP